MEVTINITALIVGLIALVGTIAITFYVRDYLQKKQEYKQLREKLEKIAGRNAKILYSPVGVGLQEFKITGIDESGITIENELHTVFIPPNKLLQTEMILPVDKYEKLKHEKLKKDMELTFDAMMPAMLDKMVPAIMATMQESMIEEKGELSMVIGMKIARVLEEEGITKIKNERLKNTNA
jgi:hypothetical protein